MNVEESTIGQNNDGQDANENTESTTSSSREGHGAPRPGEANEVITIEVPAEGDADFSVDLERSEIREEELDEEFAIVEEDPKNGWNIPHLHQRLMNAQVALDNAVNEQEILDEMGYFGYDQAKLEYGRELLGQAMDLIAGQKASYGDQFAATDTVDAAWEEANKVYMKFVKVSRIAFRENRVGIKKLGLKGPRKKAMAHWIVQTRQFYTNALDDFVMKESLAAFGITEEKLEMGLAMVNNVEEMNARQQAQKGDAQQTTVDRNAALEEIQQWIRDFRGVARVALEERPQQLEKLGILARS